MVGWNVFADLGIIHSLYKSIIDKRVFPHPTSFLLHISDFLSSCYFFNLVLSTAKVNLSQLIVLLVIAIIVGTLKFLSRLV